jgi:hypothetical protein
MQIIVSNTNLGAMFKAADNVIKKYGTDAKYQVPENIKGQSILSVFKSLFDSSFFSICKINTLEELHKVEISKEHKKWMQSLHCVNFTDMHQDTRDYLFAICVEYFKPVISMSYAEHN